MDTDKLYIGTYKVVKIYRTSGRRKVIERGLTREQAKRLVNSFPDSDKHMVVFMKQYSADKYYIEPDTREPEQSNVNPIFQSILKPFMP